MNTSFSISFERLTIFFDFGTLLASRWCESEQEKAHEPVPEAGRAGAVGKSIIKLNYLMTFSQVKNKKTIFREDPNWGHSALAETCLHYICFLPNPLRLLCNLQGVGI